MKRSTLFSIIRSSTAVALCAAAGAQATNPDGQWYRNLKKPSWNPPDAVFPIAWTALYADIAVTTGKTLADLKTADDQKQSASYLRAMVLNLMLNAGWSQVFFRSKNTGLASLWAGALALSSADLVRRTARVNKATGLALSPYAAWTAFATALSTAIWQRNR